MAAVTAAAVMALREKTGLPMMECKKALTECGGDTEQAVEWLRKQGVKTQSLLSFLHKPKLTSNEDIERPNAGSSDQAGKKNFLDGW